jgi:hypothetical protein
MPENPREEVIKDRAAGHAHQDKFRPLPGICVPDWAGEQIDPKGKLRASVFAAAAKKPCKNNA